MPVSLFVRGGAAQLTLDGRRHRASGVDVRTSTDGWASTPDRYEVEVDGGAARLSVDAA